MVIKVGHTFDAMFVPHIQSELHYCAIMVISLMLFATPNLALNSDEVCSQYSAIKVHHFHEGFESVLDCNRSMLTCDSLQAALELVKSLNNGISDEMFAICLTQGRYWISNQTNFGNVSLQIIGTGDVTVECNYPLETFSEEGDHYTWYFNQSSTLHLENIHVTNCPFPIRTIAARNVTIKDCKFTYFSEAVFDLYNCESILLNNVLIYNNSGTGILPEPYRGNTGGVSIGYHEYPKYMKPPNIHIADSEFINNSALASYTFLTTDDAVSRRVFTGRGAGLGIFMDESNQNISVDIISCMFIGNSARLFGGGLYLLFNGFQTKHQVLLKNTSFDSNSGQYGGGGVQLTFLSSFDTDDPHSAVFSDCSFRSNNGEAGGGIYIILTFTGIRGMYFRFERCNFVDNHGSGTTKEFGAAIGISMYAVFEQRVTASRHDIINCSFIGNYGSNGIISTGYSPLKFSGTNLFMNNIGSAMRIIGSMVDFHGQLNFINNSVVGEGALRFLSLGQIRMNKGLNVVFEGNKGSLGASITVSTPDTLLAFNRVLYNSQCFAIYEDPFTAPTAWEEVMVSFDHNSAVVGSSLYLSRVGHCSWFSEAPPFFKQDFVQKWPIWKFGNNTNTGYEDQYSQDYYVGSLAREISVYTNEVDSWPGKRFSMSITGIDQFDHVTSTNVRFFQAPNNTNGVASDLLKFNPEIMVIAGGNEQGLLTDNFQMHYTVSSERELSDLIEGPPVIVDVEEPFQSVTIPAGNFSIRAQLCPGGYQLTSERASVNETTSNEFVCVCIDMPNILDCENNQDGVIIRDGFWSKYVPPGTPNLFFYPCPPGYCQCTYESSLGSSRCVYMYTHSDQNLQCNPQREGLLCGSCRNNSGVSVLLDHCVTCSDSYGSLILVLVLLDVIAFLAIILIDRAVPSWIYPFIFYVQVVSPISVFVPGGIENLGVFLNYARNGLGFYFVYDFCLHSSLSTLISYSLRYLPTVVAVLVCSITWLVRKYILKKKSLAHHGYWLIVVLLYPHLVHTSLSILNCPQIPDSLGVTTARWFVDANVQCFQGWHLALALLAIVILLFSFLAVIALVLLTWKKPEFFKTFIHPLIVSYRAQEVHWWSGMELGRRLVLLITAVAFPKNTVYTMEALVILICVHSYTLPYKSTMANALEIIVLLNILILMLVETTPLIREQWLVFPGVDGGMAHISWLLFSLYYLPVVLVAGLIAAVPFGLAVRYCRTRRTTSTDTDLDLNVVNMSVQQRGNTSQIVEISAIDVTERDAQLMELESSYIIIPNMHDMHDQVQ